MYVLYTLIQFPMCSSSVVINQLIDFTLLISRAHVQVPVTGITICSAPATHLQMVLGGIPYSAHLTPRHRCRHFAYCLVSFLIAIRHHSSQSITSSIKIHTQIPYVHYYTAKTILYVFQICPVLQI